MSLDKRDMQGNKSSSEHKNVYEATWAPKDPRDRLYDEDATAAEKSASAFRIIASFHPVLNFFLLLSDMMRRIGLGKSLILLVIISLSLLFAWLFQA